jgi:hypothetical protein
VFENPLSTTALTLAEHPGAAEPDDCPDCEIYRNLAGDMYSELVSLLRFSSTMAMSSENDVDVVIRRAGGFFILQEKVTLKELSSQSLNVKGIGSGTQSTRQSQHVSKITTEALEQFKHLPTSHKWTWGETLTREEILKI